MLEESSQVQSASKILPQAIISGECRQSAPQSDCRLCWWIFGSIHSSTSWTTTLLAHLTVPFLEVGFLEEGLAPLRQDRRLLVVVAVDVDDGVRVEQLDEEIDGASFPGSVDLELMLELDNVFR